MATSRTSVVLNSKMRNRLNALAQIYGSDLGEIIRMGLDLVYKYTREYLEFRKDVDPEAKRALEYLDLVEKKAPEKAILRTSSTKKFAEEKIEERDKEKPPEEIFESLSESG